MCLFEKTHLKKHSLFNFFQSTEQFIEEYLEEATRQSLLSSVFYAPLTYDAVWSLALALNASIPLLAERKLTPLTEFTYENDKMRDVFMETMSQTNFEGMMVNFILSQYNNIIIY